MRTKLSRALRIVVPAVFFATGAANALVVVNDEGCLVHDGAGGLAHLSVADGAIVTREGDDRCAVTCQAKLPASGAPATFDRASTGGSCGVEACGFTESWSQTIAADGEVVVRCGATR